VIATGTPGVRTGGPSEPLPRDEMVARTAIIRRVVKETPDTRTFWLSLEDPEDRRAYRFRPGQFNMLYVFGVGEVAISVSSDPGQPSRLAHTIRATGRVTDAFASLRRGDRIGLRGPYGRPWPTDRARGGDLLIVAGGLGLAPVRPAIYEALRDREAYRRVIVLVGARGPEHMLYRDLLDAWHAWMRTRRIEVELTVDVADDAWPYGEGVVTTLFDGASIDPERTTAFVCGPEIMMHFAVRDLLSRGVPPVRIFESLERNMQCAVRLCGHCQLGPSFVCADGPVFSHDRIADLMEVHEL
jgi:NAD(P)H-flavin reductase